MADELKVVVDAEIELDQKQAEQEINSKAKKLDLDRVKIEGELDKEATRKNLNAAIRGIDGLPVVKIKAEFEAVVSNKSINKAADQIRKSLSKLSVPVNIEVGKMATVSPSKTDIANVKEETKAVKNLGKAIRGVRPVPYGKSDKKGGQQYRLNVHTPDEVRSQLEGMNLDKADINAVIKNIANGGYKIENVIVKTGQRVMKAYRTVTKEIKGKQKEVKEAYTYLSDDQHLQSISVGGTTKDGLSVVKEVKWNDKAGAYKASNTYGASLSETGQIVKDTKNAFEKYKQQIEKLKRDVSSIESRALKQVNPLEGGFAQQMKDEIARVRDALEDTGKIDIEKAKTEVSKLKDIFNELNALQNTQNDLAHKSVSRKVAETTPKMQTVKQIYDSYMSKLQSAGLDTSGLAEAHGNMTSAFADAGAANATSAEWEKFTLASKGYAEALKQAKFALKEFNEEAVNSNKVSKTITDFEKMTTKFNGLSQKLNLAGMSSDLGEVTAAYNKMSQAMTTAQEQNTSQAWGEYAKAHEEYARAVNKSSQALSEHNKTQREQQAAAKVAQKAQQDLLRLQKMQTEWSKAFKDPHFANQAIQIKGMLSSGDVERMRQGSRALQSLRLEIQAANKAAKTLGDRFKEMFAKFTSWFSVSQLVQQSIQGLKNMETAVVEIDASMEDLEKVTTSTRAGYDRFLDDASDKAKDLHTSITSVVDATAGWSRLGYGLKDSFGLGEWSTIYKNVGDNIESTEAATKHLVSITKAFGTEGKSMVGMVESVVDRLNAVGNKTSISSGEIGTALQNSASALQNAGNTLSESIALTVGAYDITQDASETGNMWKSVSMRIRGAKADLESMGEDTEGMVESTSKLRSQVKALTGGFDIMKDRNTFKSTYDIIIGLGEAYQKMSDSSRASLLELIAGKNRGNAVAAALNNVEEIQRAYEIAENAEGSAIKEYDTYLNHIEASRQRLQASYQSFSSSVLDSDLVKGTYDVSSGALDMVTRLVDTIGSIPTVVSAATAALSLLNNKGISNEKYAPSKKNSLAAKTRICWELNYKTNTLQRSLKSKRECTAKAPGDREQEKLFVGYMARA